MDDTKPIVAITGAAGNLGTALTRALEADYTIVGFDRPGEDGKPKDGMIAMDLSSEESIRSGLDEFEQRHGRHMAAIIHLAAYFDFSGEDNPLYQEVNEKGTRRLLRALQRLDVDRFIYSGTMLVHKATEPGQTIDERTPIKPKWAYPISKAKTEAIIHEEHGRIPYLILRLAGLYSDESGVPTLTHQIARIYEKNLKSHMYAGDIEAGQAFIHQEDMTALFRAAVDRRNELGPEEAILAGEREAVSYQRLQRELGKLIHGEEEWSTLVLPKPVAKTGAWLEEKTEPIVPDDIDKGEKPFIKPFMMDMASDHYALDISKARRLLDWEPRHHILEHLPAMVADLKHGPLAWYRKSSITPPDWLESAQQAGDDPDEIRRRFFAHYRREHADNLWAPWLNIVFGAWLIGAPMAMGYTELSMTISDMAAGVLVMILAAMTLSPEQPYRLARWALGLVGIWVMFAPLLFWTTSPAAYMNGTILGLLITGLAILPRPTPGVSPTAAMDGPTIPPGWEKSPSDWVQRIPIIALALFGFLVSRYMAAYQLGHIDAIWDPFFIGDIPGDGKNGTEEIVTSSVSEAWPVPDAGLGAFVYLIEMLTGLMGSRKRWRTMPWLVLLFGFLIVPLGAVSITFIIIQPIMLGTWCTLCLLTAAAMLFQIPYSFDEICATLEFLARRRKAGRPLLLILFTGDTDKVDEEAEQRAPDTSLQRRPLPVIRDMLIEGVNFNGWLLIAMAVGVWLMLTRLTLGSSGVMADTDHLIGALVLTTTIAAASEVGRVLRYVNIPLALGLIGMTIFFHVSLVQLAANILVALILIVVSLPKGPITGTYGRWDRWIF